MVLKARVLLLLSNIALSKQFFIYTEDNSSITCLAYILEKYYKRGSDVAVLDLNSDERHLIETIHGVEHVAIISRTAQKITYHPYSGYIIFAKDSKTFSRSYIKLTRATSWDPNAKIVIVMKYLSYSDIKEIFDLLLELHVVNVLLLNDTATVDLFTYNPYENYRCGRQYDRIIAFGQCIGQSEDKDLFYNKLITGLNRCTFRVTYTHFPPHAIDPSSSEFSLPGMNQYILSIIADKENFTINDTYKYNADEFSIIVNGSIAVGPLRALQTNKTDVVVGVMLLTGPRSRVFSYISDNYISIDYIVIQVARAQAGELSNILDEFRGIVWLSLLLVFVLYSALFLLINRNESKGVILLKLFGYLLLQSSQIRGGNKSRFVLIFWIVFAYLMNCYYLSNLVSFMTNPILEYQLASDKDIKSHNLKPCISRSVRHIVYNILNFTYPNADEKKCDDELESIRIVRRERNKFTVSLLSMYKYYETDLYDAHGKPTLYTISPPITKIIYATYLFKGFPMHSKLQEYYLRVGEVGLLSHHLSRLQAERVNRYKFRAWKKNKPMKIFIPWSILITGNLLASAVFSIELFIHFLLRKYK